MLQTNPSVQSSVKVLFTEQINHFEFTKSKITIKVGENENLESAIKRFKRKCQKDGIIGDIRKKEAYDKPSVAKKKKREAARKRARKRG